MYSTEFFKACIDHLDSKGKYLDHFCIDCLQPICLNCLAQHMFHKHVKIRRYIYSDVINRRDLCKLFNCSGIQTYHTNKAKVVFLKQRHQPHQQQQQHNYNTKLREYMCTICYKNLQDNSLYCSVACKVLAIHGNECQRKATCGDHGFEDNKEKNGGNRNLKVSINKRPKLRRKGVPIRSPMF
ncbi:protein RGF1 INDUCIBLE TRANSCRIPTION FACTOR 1-like [Argentina anserina]|uniref:protein RGF1 INDUCIBLE TRANSCRIPTION FACTOR 1-like n=1 Tax=Argentina anserina TaxID=57926 RepID=UPI00217655AB|nr:protein RGF1 INDUCIBLE TRANSCRIPTION FACTOR 1-like [Potentilla anserina]